MARETSYRVEYAEQAYKMCLLGYTNAELAVFFGVDEDTITNWTEEFNAFAYALREGRDLADASVARSLYRRAIGYTHEDVHITSWRGKPVVTPITKHYPPETAAAVHWLAVRRRNSEKGMKWPNRQDVHHSGDATGGLAEQLARALARKYDDDDGGGSS